MDFIPLMRVDLTEADISAVNEVLRSGMLVQGKKVAELESLLADYIGVKECVAVSNGTASLHLLLIANNIGNGDEVIIPALSYIATANVVELVGATPVFVDVDEHTFNIDPERIAVKITDKTKAIMPVHEFGLSAQFESISEIAKKHDLIVLEDAACSLGAFFKGKHTGSLGKAGSFSFHPRKAITSGEGGLIATDDIELANTCRRLRNHGIGEMNGQIEFIMAGLNYRMTDFQAAMLISQFGRFQNILTRKKEIARLYFEGITNEHIVLPEIPKENEHSWQTFHVLIREPLNRDQVISYLNSQNIGANYGAQCIPDTHFYRDKYQLDSKLLFPNALRAYKAGLALPMYASLKNDEIRYIIETINKLKPTK